jgi:mRNA deadenylase 3'-5' endonuclease subunit Ccr4
MENKQCQKCKQHLPLTEFHKDRTNNDGLNRWCIACKRVSRFKNCEIPEVYLKRRWDAFGQINKNRKTQRAKKNIDRIDNNKTYSKDNITFCTQNFNHKKGPLTVDTMMKVLKVFKEEGII